MKIISLTLSYACDLLTMCPLGRVGLKLGNLGAGQHPAFLSLRQKDNQGGETTLKIGLCHSLLEVDEHVLEEVCKIRPK
jgi:hypothetical protein